MLLGNEGGAKGGGGAKLPISLFFLGSLYKYGFVCPLVTKKCNDAAHIWSESV
jgi:hypothetical protein